MTSRSAPLSARQVRMRRSKVRRIPTRRSRGGAVGSRRKSPLAADPGRSSAKAIRVFILFVAQHYADWIVDNRPDCGASGIRGVISLALSCHVARQSHLGLRPCLCELPSAPRRQLMLAEHRDCPEVAPYPRCAGIPDRTPRTTFEIDEEFGARTKPSPSKRHIGRSTPLSGTKFTSEQQKALGAAHRHKDSDSSQPASR